MCPVLLISGRSKVAFRSLLSNRLVLRPNGSRVQLLDKASRTLRMLWECSLPWGLFRLCTARSPWIRLWPLHADPPGPILVVPRRGTSLGQPWHTRVSAPMPDDRSGCQQAAGRHTLIALSILSLPTRWGIWLLAGSWLLSLPEAVQHLYQSQQDGPVNSRSAAAAQAGEDGHALASLAEHRVLQRGIMQLDAHKTLDAHQTVPPVVLPLLCMESRREACLPSLWLCRYPFSLRATS